MILAKIQASLPKGHAFSEQPFFYFELPEIKNQQITFYESAGFYVLV